MIERARALYPNASAFATTLREVLSANSHGWGAILLAGDEWHVEPLREIQILDRIGGGDAFVGGPFVRDPQRLAARGLAEVRLGPRRAGHRERAGLRHPADEEQIWSIYQGNARVKR